MGYIKLHKNEVCKFARYRNLFGFDKNIVTCFSCLGYLYIITYLAFQTNICNKAYTSFSIYPRKITCIRVTIWITILYIKNVNEINSIL